MRRPSGGCPRMTSILFFSIFLQPVVGVVTRPRTGRTGVRIAAGATDFSFLQNVQAGSADPPSLLFKGYRSSFSEIKRPGREVYHQLLSIADVKNEWSYTSAPLIWLRVLDRNEFTVYQI
jgi:hypothetical protein